MPFINWDDSFDVKVRAMNAQHQKLLMLINELHEAMSAGKGRTIIAKVLDELFNYTETHFSDEEKILEKNLYPELPIQRKEHAYFVNKISELKQQNESGSLAVTFEASKFLKDWLLNHIMVEDKKYGVFLNGKGVN